MSLAVVGLGSNLGDRAAHLAQAVAKLRQIPATTLTALSGWRTTKPHGGPPGQGEFLNGAVLLETRLSPPELLAELLRIEAECGRTRETVWGPRTIDLDLLIYDQTICADTQLTLPHPRLAWRKFALLPAAEIAPQVIHPVSGWTLQQHLDHLMTPETYVAIGGIDAGVNRRFAEAVLAFEPGKLLAAPAAFSDEPAVADPNSPALPRGIASRLYLQYGALPKRTESLPPELVVSDFWFDQFAAWSAVHLPARWQPLYRQTFTELHGDLLPPKLVILVNSTAGDNAYAQQLQKSAQQSGVGPVLNVGDGSANFADPASASWQQAVQAAVVAIQSLR